MYIGHYAAAGSILALMPDVPVLPVAIAVAYPDLLWPFLIYTGKERVKIDPTSSLQKTIDFVSYPHSHSLVRSALLALVPSLIFGLFYQDARVAALFWLGAVSHWLFDVVVHRRDLPIFGRAQNDVYVGLGLWTAPRVAFVTEYAFFAGVMVLVADAAALPSLLIGGLGLHLLNANSFFGFTKKNPTSTPKQYAFLALVGFVVAIVWFTLSWR